MADVIRITALSRVTLYRRIAEGKFPPPVHLGGRVAAGHRQRYKPGSMIPQAFRSRLPRPNP
ncbi:MAG: AlpA family phage regulatory protein [Sheuella sp.]|nr:AlpA family phage regulatory protein [Sheuella sp.]